MPIASPMPLHDPLQIFLERRGAPHPVPLISTDFSVTIEGGLAIVSTRRVFRNVEAIPIEATLTFPMPVHATLFDLAVTIGDRVLHAKAQGRNRARATYEDAIDRGKSAVLHEEVLRGIHMLSVANVPAGETIEVKTCWVTTLTVIGPKGHLRIPVTVGDVYGRSPLAESDDLKTGGKPLSGTLDVHAPDACVSLAGGLLEDGKAKLVLNRPIDLIVEGWRSGTLTGIGADGRAVSLTLEAAPDRTAPLDIAILVDHSGSMQEKASAGAHGGTLTKHDHVIAALRLLADRLSAEDRIDLWQFSDNANRIGSGKLGQLVSHLAAPAGGTEIGYALERAIRESAAHGILLITDGKSHALDVQGLARMGRKISVVLVGEDSLEANVGYLAALTGGDIFVGGGADIGDLLGAALGPLRHGGGSLATAFQRSGMMVTIGREASSPVAERTLQGRAVAAVAASFLLPALPETEATDLAEREGIVSHLTSLVLVDEDGTTQEALPGQRPVALPSPVTVYSCAAAPPPMPASPQIRPRSALPPAERPASASSPAGRGLFTGLKDAVTRFATPDPPKPAHRARGIDWASDPGRLMADDLSGLPDAVRNAVLALARRDDIQEAAATRGMSPPLLVVALLALQAGRAGNRAAARIAHKLLGPLDEDGIQDLLLLLEG
ncbi:VIT domain-containing protein [Taklimakanibacter deserti]|uniref:VIT domain-containing protein n=1 Tax=Taklimakanibacter deserti TaxID=2267839 RepID=UPI0013C42609